MTGIIIMLFAIELVIMIEGHRISGSLNDIAKELRELNKRAREE